MIPTPHTHHYREDGTLVLVYITAAEGITAGRMLGERHDVTLAPYDGEWLALTVETPSDELRATYPATNGQ